jgi:NADPH-dependent 2,4-dienoyl-CoA reductase/sulfur reductase-like enzyme/pSer/pThr/pTyr-binding forkhead associated (FHA) protein
VAEHVIIGDGAAGTTAAQYIRRRDPAARITVYSDDPNPAYYRAALTNYLIGELREDQLFAVPPDFYERHRIHRVLARVMSVDPANRRIGLANGSQVPYDTLLVAAGSSPNPPPFPGAELAGVMTMRTMQDARTFMEELRAGRVKRAVVVGGGPLALEWAQGLRARGAEVTFLLRGREFMAGVLDRTGSDLVASRLRAFGCDLRMEEEVAEILGDKRGRVRAVTLKHSGQTVDAQLVCVAIGIRTNTWFLEGSGIQVNRGIPVDERMRTNVEDVYAAGDVAEVYDPVAGGFRGLGLWEPARLQGRVAGSNMGGGDAVYRVGVLYNATRLYDLDFAGLGRTIEREGDRVVADLPRGRGTIAYRKLVLEDGHLVGAILLGHRSERVRRHGLRLRKVIEDRLDVSDVADDLLDPAFDLPGWLAQQTGAERAATTGFALGGAVPSYSRLFKIPELASPLSRAIRLPAASEMAAPALLPEPPSGVPAPVAVLEPPPPTGGGPGHRAKLSVIGGATIELGAVTRIGRAPDGELVLADPLVSGRHAEVRATEQGYVLVDVGSRNGTFVGNERLSAPHRLADGDQIRVGDTTLRFEMPTPAAAFAVEPAGGVTVFGAGVGAAVSGLFVRPDALEVPPPPSAPAMGTLEGAGRRFELRGGELSLGRDPASDIALEDPAVSYVHAQITEHEGRLYVRDLGSRNGTWVNATLVTTPHPLADGDVLHVGATDLVFRAAGGPATPSLVTPAPPEPAPAPPPPGPVAPPAGFRLVVVAGASLGNVFSLAGPEVLVGRNPEAGVVLSEPTVSWQHARLRAHGAAWTIADLGSTNGTRVNGAPIEPEREIPIDPGDEIALGEALLRFEAVSG